jgi:hypothetical protein
MLDDFRKLRQAQLQYTTGLGLSQVARMAIETSGTNAVFAVGWSWQSESGRQLTGDGETVRNVATRTVRRGPDGSTIDPAMRIGGTNGATAGQIGVVADD